MSPYWFKTKWYDNQNGTYKLERYSFNTVYADKNLGVSDKEKALAIWKYNSEDLFSAEYKFTYRIPSNGERGVQTVKAVSKDLDINFTRAGELSSYNIKQFIIFIHVKSLESDFSYEIGKSVYFPKGGIDVDYLKVLSGENEPLMADEEASYIDFYYHSQGKEDGGDYTYKHRNTLDGSQRASLSLFEGVAGDFDERWWETIDLSGDYQYIGTTKDDVLKAYADKNYGADLIDGRAGDDQLFGFRGADVLIGGLGDDLLRAGNGRDVITGGPGQDVLYGGFGHNAFTGEKDGSKDKIYFKSDQFSENWIYGKAGNNPNGKKVDVIKGLDSYDKLFIQGVKTSGLSFSRVSSFATPTGNFSGIGIFANGFLEGLYTGDDLSIAQLKSMTVGVDV